MNKLRQFKTQQGVNKPGGDIYALKKNGKLMLPSLNEVPLLFIVIINEHLRSEFCNEK